MNLELKNYYLHLLQRRDYTSGQLVEKAQKKGYTGGEIKEVLFWLEEEEMVNDLRFATILVEKYSSTKGEMWLNAKLKYYKVPETIIAQVLDQHSPENYKDLKLKIEKKYNIDNWKNIEPHLKQKIANYLNRQGFKNSWSIIESFLDD